MAENYRTETAFAAATDAAVERLLNTYLRETGQSAQTLLCDDLHLTPLPAHTVEALQAEGHPFCLHLPTTDARLFGALTYASLFGHHRYGKRFWLEQDGAMREADGGCLIERLLHEVGRHDEDERSRDRRLLALQEQVGNSIDKTKRFLDHHLTHPFHLWELTGGERTASAESRLMFGHPFHPTPKSSEGFSADDLVRYAPELGATFVLRYFAADPAIVQEAWVNEAEGDLFPPALLAEASDRLPADRAHYKLLPCHPWQADHLLGWPDVQDLIQSGLLVYLGPLGAPVHPTSSVRTVWSAELPCYLKLPLNVRITNFIRVNPLDQLQRTLDAATYTESLRPLPEQSFTILAELGYRTLAPVHLPEERAQKLVESFATIFRENPVTTAQSAQQTPVVVASLLETKPGDETTPLFRFVELAARTGGKALGADFVQAWVRRYVQISLVPLLNLFFEHGYSAEAHVQNSMVTLDHGWPAHFYVRDLEGVSVSREQASATGKIGTALRQDSPALYADQQAWHRFKYYILVNHLGHLLHTLAHDTEVSEAELWKVVAEAIRTEETFRSDRAKRGIDDLLTCEHLPAKANLISRFQERGETPLYVNIPNPLMQTREVRA
ncbi:IucA/IucC family protein [Tumebacillus lipolyticus]|uniref:IucA/IucC family protein n=1 Tax=Tumebacillus lipolyticus TaxID=1280370 RepID=A0ABW5A1X3_9BACL